MSYYVLPHISTTLNEHNIRLGVNTKIKIFINHNLQKLLKKEKQCIQYYEDEWDIYKKYKNPYEFIHTNIFFYKKAVCKYKPLSRAFFKMIEISNIFKFNEKYNERNIQTFHLAEGPGGFIEAMIYLRQNKFDKYHGMTLIDNKNNIPGWKKSKLFLKKNPNVLLEYGKDGTGNLYNPINFTYCIEKYKNSMDIITGDGGFDFSIDYDKQEYNVLKLLLAQIFYALAMQKKGGTFILKIFDIFLKPSVEFIYILSCFYHKVSIIKPNTSRYANSEKYVVCEDFKSEDNTKIIKKFHSVLTVLYLLNDEKYKIKNIINIPIQCMYLSKIKEINAIFGQQQLDIISSTFKLIENDETKNDIINKNILKCIKWCEKNNMPYNIF